jgi:density-regulated protein DRP1
VYCMLFVYSLYIHHMWILSIVSKKKSGDDDKKSSAPVIIKVSQRNKRKCVTIISGVENHGVNHKDAASFFKKKFSCGASVVKKPEIAIEIQGDFKEDLLIILPEQFKIPANVLKVVIEKKKKKSEEQGVAAQDDDSDDE